MAARASVLLSLAIVAAAPVAHAHPALDQVRRVQATVWKLFGASEVKLGASAAVLGLERAAVLQPLSYDAMKEGRTIERFVKSLHLRDGRTMLQLVNNYFNRQPYREDIDVYGRTDHWASLSEFMANGGDCEDFALAKYRVLLAAGFPPGNLRVVLVNDTRTDSHHAVLVARLNGATLVLDNQRDEIVNDREIGYYQPLYSFTMKSTWQHHSPRTVPLREVMTTTEPR